MKTDPALRTNEVMLTDWEKKLVERFRDSLEKAKPGEMQVGRQFSWPSPEDSEENMHIAVSVYVSQWTRKMSADEAKVGLFEDLGVETQEQAEARAFRGDSGTAVSGA